MLRKLSLLPLLALSVFAYGQRGKHTQAPYATTCTVTSANYQMNAYTAYTGADIAAPTTTLTVANATMTNSFFTTNLGPGDLIMIIQMQGAGLDIDPSPGGYTVPYGHSGDWGTTIDLWGGVAYYFNAGYYELREVRSVSGNVITLNCATQRPYTATGTRPGHIQIVRIPRLSNLTLNANTSIVPQLWDGTTGGIVALEVDGNITFGANSKISATGFGFRGGVADNTSTSAPASTNATDIGFPGTDGIASGSEKGEGIGGSAALEYITLESRYGKGAPGNGGGGGNPHNAGGGGGSNVGTGTYYGYGVPNPAYAASWNLETQSPNMVTTPSSGGGRGGYSYAITDQNELTVGPNNNAWGGDRRRNEGGYGGHTLTYDVNRLFMGGGGGAGEMNGNQGGSGGRGGGIVFLQLYGTISGPAVIEANGAPGQNANPNNLIASNASTTKYGNDGAGGAGGAGAIVISNGTGLPAATINAVGGKGGDQALSYGQFAGSPTNEIDGPGGGGAGGQISVASIGSATPSVAGGASGIVTVLSTYPTTNFTGAFPPNGATGGGAGITNTTGYFDILVSNVSICKGNSTTLTATIQGALPGGVNVTWYNAQYGGSAIGSGLTYNTGVLNVTTTYYVGTCPGTFRKPVVVTVGGATISGTAVVTNATCSAAGSITGLTTSGGQPAITITWNGVVTPTMDLNSASAGSYTVTVTDGLGCTVTSGPYVISSTGGPTINTTNMVVTNANCLGNNGSITGITASGTGLMPSWSNGPTSMNNTGLASGNYTLTVTDVNGCIATAGPIPVGLTPGPSINPSGLVVTNETCNQANGAINGITASGTGLTYSWNGTTTANANYTGLSAGIYNLTVTDNIGCTATYGPVNISNIAGPTLNLTNQVNVDEHCTQTDGSISGIQIAGGLPGYTISWNGGAYNTLDIANLSAGNYSLTVSDANGCNVSAGPFTLQNLPGPSINTTNMVITNESCSGGDGSITGITATGSGLTYSWNLSPSATLDHLNLTSGNYALLVTDQFGCPAAVGPFVVGVATSMVIDSANLVVTPSGCVSNVGSIVGLTITGGVNPQFTWSNGSPTLDNTNLNDGSYTLTVTDDQNCTVTANFFVGVAPGPSIDITGVTLDPDHCNQSDGGVSDIIVTGGAVPYTYVWDANATLNTLDLVDAASGNHTLVVTDDVGCTATTTVNVPAVSGPAIDITGIVYDSASCNLSDGGVSNIVVTNGTQPYGYVWDSNASLNTIDLSNAAAGNHTLVVMDDAGCSATTTVNIPSLAGPSISIAAVMYDTVHCAQTDGGVSNIVVTGGTEPYTYVWDSNASLNTLNLSNTTAGNHTIVVTDNGGCTASATVTIPSQAGPVINAANLTVVNATCELMNGSISNLIVTGNGPITYSWAGTGLTSLNLTGIGAGTYTLTAIDAFGCQTVGTPIVVTTTPMPYADFTISPSLVLPNDLVVFTDATTNAVPTSWGWITEGTAIGLGNSANHTYTTEGTYTVTLIVETASGCTDTVTKTIVVYGELIVPNVVTRNNDGVNDVFEIKNLKPNTKLFVQNRWGNLVFETDNYLNDWKGIDKAGETLVEGTYFYQIITVDGKVLQGNVYLLNE
jgi:gliding motility-associated-like protein